MNTPPKPYHRPMPRDWFLMRRNYKLFIVRELTSVFIAVYLIVLLVFLASLDSREEFTAMLETFKSPLWWVIHAIVFIAAAWHAITWFNLTPQAMPMFIGEKKLAGPLVSIATGYVPWIILSIVIMMAVCP